MSDADLARYYAQRAESYERIYQKPERQVELRALEAWLPSVFAGRRVLEIAWITFRQIAAGAFSRPPSHVPHGP